MVKCSECGFLSAKNMTTRNLEEVEGEFRRSGNSPNGIMSGKEIDYPRHKEYPICFVQKYDLIDSFERISGQKPARFLTIINKERECELFTKWQQGFTPKDHREMMDRDKMLKWQTEREEVDRKWREDQRKDDLLWRADQEQKASRRHRWDLIIIGIVATLLICGATIAAAFIARGS